MHSRRALLYVPGDDLRKIRKAASLGADCICLDLEDGVAASRKEAARSAIAEGLSSVDFHRSERLARINPVGSGLESADLESLLPARPDGIVVPKVENGDQIRWVSSRIATFENASGWQIGRIGLIAIVESALAIVQLREIASADSRLQALIFGAEDLAGDIGAVRTASAWEVLYARSAVVTHAAAYNLQSIDMVYLDFHDEAGLRKEAIQGAELGYSGKQVIHPNQVVPVQEAFTPTPAEIERALRVKEAYESHQSVGVGAFAQDGKMVDAPVVKAAERVLARARAAGKIQ